ncbi:MAG: exosortase T [Deltaproteobacteria bacterium]|nr:exosortase T [Deltaproteobacteria bacterium]
MGARHIGWAILPGLLLLAIHPARWLTDTWFDEGYASIGEWIFLLVLSVFAWSATSARVASPSPRGGALRSPRAQALLLLLFTAAVRVFAELWAINTLGALALVIDVYAIALGLELHARRRAASPLGLALLFALSLPIERLIQRGLGHPLQRVSAELACAVLSPLDPALTCHGTLIQSGPVLLSVDLPCSGAQGLVLLTTAVLFLASIGWLRGARATAALATAAAGAVAGNALRLVIIAELTRRGVDAASEPTHSVIGLFTLGAGAGPVLWLARRPRELLPSSAPARVPAARLPSRGALIAASALSLGLGLLVLAVPARPLDVSAPTAPITLPFHLGPWLGDATPLSPKESLYFARYGGQAVKTHYRGAATSHTAVLVRTRSPLRHLHGPDECLIGAGHRVRLAGVRRDDHTAVFRSEAPSGEAYRVEVTYFATDGRRATTAPEVIWSALLRPGASWTMVERISAWDQCEGRPELCAQFDRALLGALDLLPAATPEVAAIQERTR